MSDEGGEKVIDLAAKFNIKELLATTAARREQHEAAAVQPEAETVPDTVPPLDRLTALPQPGDPYKAYARPANQMLPTLYLITGNGRKLSYPYSSRIEGPHLLDGEAGKGPEVVLRFSASVTVEVRLMGRHLDDLHNYLGYHRIAWVRELPKGKIIRDNPDMPVPVITGISVERVEGWPPLGAE